MTAVLRAQPKRYRRGGKVDPTSLPTGPELFPKIIQHFTEKGVTVVYETSDLDHPQEVI